MQDLQRILNPEQYAAATAGDGPLLVLAAAGTGKTQTLVYRVAVLVERGVPPESILLLTFTNRAAKEMLERARQVAGDRVGGVWGGTFHHVCNRLLRRHAGLVGFRPGFAIADRDDSKKLVDDVLKELGISPKSDNFPKREVLLSLFGNAANRDLPLETVLEEKLRDVPFDTSAILKVHEAYARRKAELGVMDFDDLLVNGLRLLEEHPEILDFYRRQFRYVLVDEYQDTNAIQSRFVDLLSGEHGNLMAVGDDFQCIYSWRGADFRNIMEFPKRHPDARIIKLERNYRSTPQILSLANTCIAGNPEQFQKTLVATRPGGDRPIAYHVYNGAQQAELVATLIRSAVADGLRPGDIAVLYRAHFHSIELQMALSRKRVRYLVTSGVGVFEQAHVKDMLSLLRLAIDPFDRLAFDRLLGLLPGVGPRSLETMWKKLGGSCDLSKAEGRDALLGILRPAAREPWQKVSEAIAAFHEDPPGPESRKGNVPVLVDAFLDAFYARLLRKSFENAEEREDDVREVASQAQTQAPTLADFLQNVALLTNAEAELDRADGRGEADRVRLSTVHQAKGLEWPFVIIIWACEGMFPSSRSLGENEDDSEERRLFYVALTRARSRLVIVSPEMRTSQDGYTFPCQASRFLEELPKTDISHRTPGFF